MKKIEVRRAHRDQETVVAHNALVIVYYTFSIIYFDEKSKKKS